VTPLALFLLACALVFLGTIESAFSTLMRLSLRLMAERGGRSDRLGQYLDEPMTLFIPLRVLIATCTIFVGLLIATLTGVQNAEAIATFLLSVVAFVLVCEHLLPMLIIRRDPEAVLDVLLPVFHPIARFVRPLTAALIRVVEGRRERDTGDAAPEGTEAQPASASDQVDEENAISEEEGRELLQSIVDFTETVVREVMTPRPDIVAIRSDATLAQLRDLFREQQYSRIPVYGENLDNIIGIVFVKDLVALPPGTEPPLTSMMRSAYFVPASKRVSELLKELQRKQAHMAIVVDEYGGTAGLVTVEDLIEEIVGEIRDEYDVETEPIVDEGNGNLVVSGRANVEEVADKLGVEIEREGFETVGGYLLARLGRMPYIGERLEIDDLEAEVLEVERRRINRVRLRRRVPALEEDTP
jgi:CBS domain containing-hemolysin-like protein